MMIRLLRRSLLGLLFFALHTAFVGTAWSQKGDGSGFYWMPIALADLPVTAVVYVAAEVAEVPFDKTTSAVAYLIGGGLQWCLIGVGVQAACGAVARWRAEV